MGRGLRILVEFYRKGCALRRLVSEVPSRPASIRLHIYSL